MKEAKCLMKAIRNPKHCKLDQTTLITKERSQVELKTMMIDTKTTTISKDLQMLLIKKITMIVQTTTKTQKLNKNNQPTTLKSE